VIVRRRDAVGLLVAAAALGAGCRRGWLFGPLGREPPPVENLAWTEAPADALAVTEGEPRGAVSYAVALPPAAGAPPLRRVELRFAQSLDGARVDVQAIGPRGWLTLVDGRRTGGDTVSIPIPPVDADRLQVTVHHHLRPLPVVAEVRFGRAPGQTAGADVPR